MNLFYLNWVNIYHLSFSLGIASGIACSIPFQKVGEHDNNMKAVMKFFQRLIYVILSAGLLVLSACSSTTPAGPDPLPQNSEEIQQPSKTRTALPEAGPTSTGVTASFSSPHYFEFPDAQSVSVAAGGGSAYIVYGHEKSLFVSRSSDGGQTFTEPVQATHNIDAFVLPVERPAIAVNRRGDVGVAWLEHAQDGSGTNVWYASSMDAGHTFGSGMLVSTEHGRETVMVHLQLDETGNPLLFWIRDVDLRFARSFDQGKSFDLVETIGEGSCECCQPSTVVLEDQVIVAYRSLVEDGSEGFIRDIAVVSSLDGGRSFGPVTQVSDEHWYLDACPIAGPSLAHHDGRLYAAWMDGRTAPRGSHYDGDIWFALSGDLGKTFSANRRVNAGESTHNTLPVLAVGQSGRIHLAWEGQDQDAIYYTTSDDSGENFTPGALLAGNEAPERGSPSKPSIAVDGRGQVYLAWLDRSGARVVSWKDQP